MSEKPLFQNTDEQEAIYAPQQLPDGTLGEQSAAAEGDTNEAVGPADALIPAVVFAGGANAGGMGPSVGTTGTSSGVAPAAGLLGLTAAANDDADDTTTDRNDNRG